MLRVALAIAAVAALAACGDDGEAIGSDGVSGPISVAAAVSLADGTEVEVRGHLIALPGGTAELCGGPVMESAPPQCGDPALPVDGLDDPASLEGAADAGGWVEGDVTLRGTVQGGRLQVP